ncbi:hypothetical protein [Streptomyces sp. 3N207]
MLHPVATEILTAFVDRTTPGDAAKILGHLMQDTVHEAVEALTSGRRPGD